MMPEVTTKMSLVAWDQPLDAYSYKQFADNWNKVDFHDHTPGRGVPIPMGGLAPGAVGLVELSTEVPVIQTGSLLLWPQALAPGGYLACDGTAYLITAYPNLFSIIGGAFDLAPPAGYFNVPNVSMVGPLDAPMIWIIKV